MKSSDIHIRAISQQMPQPSIIKILLKISQSISQSVNQSVNLTNTLWVVGCGYFGEHYPHYEDTALYLLWECHWPLGHSACHPSQPHSGAGSCQLINLLWTCHSQDCFSRDIFHRADSRFAPSQWETMLLCNDVSHWLGASLESSLFHLICSRVQPNGRQ